MWDHSSFSKNRDRLLAGDIAAKFLFAVLAQPKIKRLLSSDHFSVDGTLMEAWAPTRGEPVLGLACGQTRGTRKTSSTSCTRCG